MFVLTLIIGGSLVLSKTTFASEPTLSVKEFNVWNKNGVIGYTAGFILNGATFNNSKSIIVNLYGGNTLLQTNIAVEGKIIGNEFVTPFDVFGGFDYKKDGYFINIRGAEYGRNIPPTKVVITTTLSDGKTLSATSYKLVGDISTIGVTPISGQVLGLESFHFTQLMKVGSKGNEVTELQKYLNNAGYNCGVVDGVFGQITKNATIKFQIANGLLGDGVVGSMTRKVLNK